MAQEPIRNASGMTPKRPVLDGEDVGCVAAEVSGFQRVDDRLFVDAGAPAHVDQEGAFA
jgi:hypothetical protein